MVECPLCFGEIKCEAKKCRHCGEWVNKENKARDTDERVSCSSCKKKMVPRIITGPPIIRLVHGWTPVPKKSVCPFCAKVHQKFPLTLGEKIRLSLFVSLLLVVFLYILMR